MIMSCFISVFDWLFEVSAPWSNTDFCFPAMFGCVTRQCPHLLYSSAVCDNFILFYLLPPPCLIWPVPTSQVPCSFPPYFPWRFCSWSLWVDRLRPVYSGGLLPCPQLSSCGTLWPLCCCWAGSACTSSSISCHLERCDTCCGGGGYSLRQKVSSAF